MFFFAILEEITFVVKILLYIVVYYIRFRGLYITSAVLQNCNYMSVTNT